MTFLEKDGTITKLNEPRHEGHCLSVPEEGIIHLLVIHDNETRK